MAQVGQLLVRVRASTLSRDGWTLSLRAPRKGESLLTMTLTLVGHEPLVSAGSDWARCVNHLISQLSELERRNQG